MTSNKWFITVKVGGKTLIWPDKWKGSVLLLALVLLAVFLNYQLEKVIPELFDVFAGWFYLAFFLVVAVPSVLIKTDLNKEDTDSNN